jgi:hypothetical protein
MFFNTAGPGKVDKHYLVDPLRRIDSDEILKLIQQKRYFVLHAPRQTGKTTSLLALVKSINEGGEYACVYVNVENAQTARNDVAEAMLAITVKLGSKIEEYLGDTSGIALAKDLVETVGGNFALESMLENYCKTLSKPLVLFIDEIDSLIGDSLISVLRQLRSGYASRPDRFPISVILCGVRDIRDYRIHQSNGEIITGGSCFNVKAKSLRLGDFSIEEIRELYEQHTQATGQIFEEAVYPKVWDLTLGQPWLVNALANRATEEIEDRHLPITLECIEKVAYDLILACETHLDQLADKLSEPRVQKVIAPMLAGDVWEVNGERAPLKDDIQYVIDLGLIRRENGKVIIANAIYREVIPRELTTLNVDNMTEVKTAIWYLSPDGKIEINRLLKEFQLFFQVNIGVIKGFKEAEFQLILQAFLQRVINGGGLVEREYALGNRRVDLLIRYPSSAPGSTQQRIAIELKTITDTSHASIDTVLKSGLEQTYEYALLSKADSAHLIICDQRNGKTWDEKIYDRIDVYQGREIHVWGV